MSASAILTLGYGPSGSASHVITLGYGIGEEVVPPEVPPVLAGAPLRRPRRIVPQIEVFHAAEIRVSGGGMVRVLGHKEREALPDDEVLLMLMDA